MWQEVNNGGHGKHAIEIFEHLGIPVLVHHLGQYPEATDGAMTTRDCACIKVSIRGRFRSDANGTKPYYTGVAVCAEGAGCRGMSATKRTLLVWQSEDREEREGYAEFVAAARDHLDDAVEVLNTIDSTYDAAEARIAQAWAYKDSFESRADYERACAVLGVEARSDEACGSYGVRYGNFTYPQYDPDHIVTMHLARLRMVALDCAAKVAMTAGAPGVSAAPLRRAGQLWEACERCGAEPVYMPLHLCEKCWPLE